MKNYSETLPHLEPGKPAEKGQLILQRRWRILKQTVVSSHLNGRILDLGCGNGAQTEVLAGEGLRVIGLDYYTPPASGELTIRDENHTRYGSFPPQPPSEGWFPFVSGDAMELPFRSQSFDLVVSFEVLEHLPDDMKAMGEVYRVLKPNGGFFFTVPNRWWIFETHGAKIPGLPFIPWNRVPFLSYLPKVLHDRIAKARIYTIKQVKALTSRSGFQPLHWGYITAPLDVLPEGWLRKTLRKTFFSNDTTGIPLKAVNLYFYCQKF